LNLDDLVVGMPFEENEEKSKVLLSRRRTGYDGVGVVSRTCGKDTREWSSDGTARVVIGWNCPVA
jgi:hypothetical protein